jgi:hypothetical protein
MFDPDTVRDLAKQTGFAQRLRKLDPFRLALALVLATTGKNRKSYKALVAEMHTVGSPEMRPQSLAERVDFPAATFLLTLLRLPLQTLAQKSAQVPSFVPDWLSQFPGIWATDSSTKLLPATLAQQFPSSGGDASPAGLKLHLSLSVLSPELRAFQFTQSRAADQLPVPIDSSLQGVLHLFDKALGSRRPVLCALDQVQQFFVTPLWLPMPLFDAQGHRLDVASLCQTHVGTEPWDQDVFLGNPLREDDPYGRLRVRLVALRLPPEVAQQRRRRSRKQAKDQGHTLSQRTLQMMDWLVVLTNVPALRLTAEQVLAVYRLRWQVELMFRQWKHLYGMKQAGYDKPGALYCHLIATLIAATMMSLLHGAMFASWDPGQQAEPSPYIVAALFVDQGPLWLLALAGDGGIVFRRLMLRRMIESILMLGRMEKRRRQSSRRRILDPHLALLE